MRSHLALPPVASQLTLARSIAALYISEISPPAIRGQLVGMFEIGWQIGGLVGELPLLSRSRQKQLAD